MPDARRWATVALTLLAVGTLVAGAAGSARPVVAASIQVEETPQVEDGRVLFRFTADTEKPVALNVQMGVALPGTCAFRQLEDGQKLIIRARKAAAEPGAGLAAGLPGCSQAARSLDLDEAGARLGAAVRHELQPGEHPLHAFIRVKDHFDMHPQARYFLLVWQDGADKALLLQAGASFQAETHVDAGALALANMTMLALALPPQPKDRSTDWTLPWPLLWLFSRLKRPRLLEHRARRSIMDHVEEHPGARWFELQSATGFPSGVLTHHLRVLEQNGLVLTVRRGSQRHLYPVVSAAVVRRHLTERQEEILRLLRQRPYTQTELAQRLRVTQQAISYQIRKLRCQGMLVNGATGCQHPQHQPDAAPPPHPQNAFRSS